MFLCHLKILKNQKMSHKNVISGCSWKIKRSGCIRIKSKYGNNQLELGGAVPFGSDTWASVYHSPHHSLLLPMPRQLYAILLIPVGTQNYDRHPNISPNPRYINFHFSTFSESRFSAEREREILNTLAWSSWVDHCCPEKRISGF